MSRVAAAFAAAALSLPCAAATTVADSVADYATTAQGVKGWHYGWAAGDIAAYTAKAFKAMPVPAGATWYEDPDNYWTQVYATGQHPEGGARTTPPKRLAAQVAVRRWIAPADGTYTIAGQVQHVGGGGSDGVAVRIVKNKLTLWQAAIAPMGEPLAYSLKVKLTAGQPVDFVLGPGAASDDVEDSTNFNAVITTK